MSQAGTVRQSMSQAGRKDLDMSIGFKVAEKTVTISYRQVEKVENVRIISPSQSLDKIKCTACKNRIGDKRPIVLVWAEDRPWRLCNSCGSEIIEKYKQSERIL